MLHFARLILFLLLLSPLAAWPASLPAASYRFTTIDAPFPGGREVTLTGLNDKGHMVGLYLDRQYRDQGLITVIPDAIPQGVNDARQIVGWVNDDDGIHGFLHDPDGFRTFDMPGAVTGGRWLTEPIAINDYSQIVGDYRDSRGRYHGFLYDEPSGSFWTIDPPFPNLTGSALTAINNRLQLLGMYEDAQGRHGFYWYQHRAARFEVPGAQFILPRGISDAGHIVGTYGDGQRNRGFLYYRDTFYTIDIPEPQETDIWGINKAGQIVGRYIDRAGIGHGFLGTPTEAMARR